jgi:hypothetical protein
MGSYWKRTSRSPPTRRIDSSAAWACRVARRVVVDEEHRPAQHHAGHRLAGLGLGHAASGGAGSRRPRRGSFTAGRRPCRWTLVIRLLPRMLFIERISRPSVPST